jgi:hypothetical protein
MASVKALIAAALVCGAGAVRVRHPAADAIVPVDDERVVEAAGVRFADAAAGGALTAVDRGAARAVAAAAAQSASESALAAAASGAAQSPLLALAAADSALGLVLKPLSWAVTMRAKYIAAGAQTRTEHLKKAEKELLDELKTYAADVGAAYDNTLRDANVRVLDAAVQVRRVARGREGKGESERRREPAALLLAATAAATRLSPSFSLTCVGGQEHHCRRAGRAAARAC